MDITKRDVVDAIKTTMQCPKNAAEMEQAPTSPSALSSVHGARASALETPRATGKLTAATHSEAQPAISLVAVHISATNGSRHTARRIRRLEAASDHAVFPWL